MSDNVPRVPTAASQPPQEPGLPQVFAQLPVGVGILRDGRWTWANHALCRLVGHSPEQLLGQDFRELLVHSERERIWNRYTARRGGGYAPTSYEVGVVRGDGQVARLEIEPQPLDDGGVVVLVRGLGERMRDSALLGALSELALRVQRARTLDSVLDASVRGLSALGFSACVVRTQGASPQIMRADVAPEVRATLEAVMGAPIESWSISTGALATKIPGTSGSGFFDDLTPLLVDVLQAHGRPVPEDLGLLLQNSNLEKVAWCSLVVNGQQWGRLFVASSTLRSNDAAALALFSAQVATSIEVATFIDDLSRRNRQLEALQRVLATPFEHPVAQVAPVLLEIVCRATASDCARLFLLDLEQRVLSRTGVFPLALSDDEPVPLPLDFESVRQFIDAGSPWRSAGAAPDCAVRADADGRPFLEHTAIPLKVSGRPWGVLTLSRTTRSPYSDDELRSAEILAAQLAAQVERAQLHADAQHRVEELSLMNEVGGLIAHDLELRHVLHTAVRHISRIVGVENAFLLLLDDSREELVLEASNVDASPLRLRLDERSAASQAVRDRRPVVTENTGADPYVSAIASRFGHQALLSIPLVSEGRPIGALVLGETRGPRRFTRVEIDRAVAMANQLASAVDNARLYDEQRLRVEQLRLLVDMSRIITGSLELEPILREGAGALVRMIDATDAYIWFLEGTELQGRMCVATEHLEQFRSMRLSLAEPSATAMSIQLRAPVRIENAERSPEVSHWVNAVLGQKSLLAIPLMLRDVPIGAITIGDRRQTRRYTDDEVERALLISRQLAIAIDNARLFEDLKRSYHELSRAQQELVKRERLAALGELSAVIAHEVRNPLGVIFNSLATLKRTLPSENDARMLLGIVGEEAERLNRMVGDLLDFARPNEPQLHPEALDEVVKGALEAAHRAMSGHRVRLHAAVPDALPPVPVDAQMLRQAIVNLVVNAVQAMPRGGNITVRAQAEDRAAGRFVRLEVEDDGPGIPAELADRVFQPFFTTRAAGTGLGLAVVKRIADAHHAELTLRSEAGRGSCFTLWLPA